MRFVLSVLCGVLVLSGYSNDVLGGVATTTPPAPAFACTAQGPSVSPAAATLSVGDTLRIHAAMPPCPFDTVHVSFSWESSNSAVAAVDSTGLVRAVAKGVATIIASGVQAPAVQAAAAITVVSK